ncbi:hypothetical protein WA1_39840 [Scytonema hofmannii PCC 7110]|uniref:Uncharacterized protein n=1 Tax=Scytonema hofmannii PCC 7110 TaxID=128403 RepID=A0A139WYU6_9CYAN|nr:hypothetical protein [Scytonema hofmannii]KYC37619.1 hypothetical protein WA1_39840 [Scytonema hofmannii PCC 7110]
MDALQFRTNVLVAFGASNSEITELLAYNQNIFGHDRWQFPQTFPPPAEPYISAWKRYVAQAETEGAYTVLKQSLIQLQFPIVAGMSETKTYRAATRQGKLLDSMAILFQSHFVNATGLILSEPEKLQIQLYQSLAGLIPAIVTGNRKDFVSLVQALTQKNEPQPVPDSMGACIVSGYNNWERIRQYRQQWENQQAQYSETDWNNEFKRLIPHKELYQDRFIIVSPGFYSNIAASDLGLSETQWQQLSLKIRLEHECTHYFTRRFLGSMRNNIFDELIADYRGIVAAIEHYRSDWFLHFVGLESFPLYREGGRLQNYRGEPPLSDKAFKILQALVKSAAENVECFDKQYSRRSRTVTEQVLTLIALTTLTLEELACESGKSLLEDAYYRQQQQLFTSLVGNELHADKN